MNESECGNVVCKHASRQLRKTCRIINFHLCKCCVSLLFFSLLPFTLHLSFPCFAISVTSPLASVERIAALTQHELLNGLFAGTPKVNKYTCSTRQTATNKQAQAKGSRKSAFISSFFCSSLCVVAICRIVTLHSWLVPGCVSCQRIY